MIKDEEIKLFKDGDKNIVIILSPDLEIWIYDIAKKEGIKVSDFWSSDNHKNFRKESKIASSKF